MLDKNIEKVLLKKVIITNDKESKNNVLQNEKDINDYDKIKKCYDILLSRYNDLLLINKHTENKLINIYNKKHIFNEKNKFNFTFNGNNGMNKSYFDCIYCKCKDEEISILRTQNKKIRDQNIDKDKKIEELKNYINDFINQKSESIDDLIYIDYDVFQYESTYSLEKQIGYYEKQLDIIDSFLLSNDINNFLELKNKITKSSLNDKYHNINILLNDLCIKSQNSKFECLLEDQKYIDNKIKTVKYKLSKLKTGTILEIKGIKKVYKHKNEKKNNIKMIEEQFNEYCKKRISWARSVIGNEYNDEKIINLLDLFDKLNKNYKSDNSSDDELSSIFNDLKENKFKEYNIICNLGKYFINNNIEDKITNTRHY